MSQSPTAVAQAPSDFVRGDATGLDIPAHGEALRSGGVAWLTEAFRAFGVLDADNAVARITRWDVCPGGSTGQKFFLSVAYARPDPDLHADLFVKFSRDFGDKMRDDRGKYEMEGEIRFGALSHAPDFPIDVPKAYFADYQATTHTGLLITQRIDFGVNGVEPQHLKCLDYMLAEPIAYYRQIVRSLARIAAAHRSGRLSADIDAMFPYDPEEAAAASPFAHNAEELRAAVRKYAEFVADNRQLFPPNFTPAFFDRMAGQVELFVANEARLKRFNQSDPDYVALCHWNANIDNGWFWRDDAGELHCGLMDWGHAGQMNLAYALWGCLSGAPLSVWNDHLDELLDLFLAELRANGGPHLDKAELRLHLHMYMSVMALWYFIHSPARILFRLPETVQATSPDDPIFLKSETARNQLKISINCLNLWEREDFGASLEKLLARTSAHR